MKNFQQKLELIKAVCLVADFWEVEPADLLAFVTLTKQEKKDEWNKIALEVQEFTKMDIAGRAEKLGMTVSYSYSHKK
jgi:hypothetical protein